MKLRVDRDVFADAVAWIAKSLPPRPSVPVLAGALLTVDDNRLVVSGFDYEVSNQVTIDVVADSSGSALVSGKLLSEIVKALPNKPIDLSVEGSHIELTCGSARFTLPTMPVEDYPSLPEMPSQAGTINAATFAAAVSQTATAAGRDDTLPTMTGIQLEFNGTNLSLLSTDRYRMAIRDLEWNPSNPDINVTTLIPAKALSDTAKTLGSRGTDVAIALPDGGAGPIGMVGFWAEGRRTTSRVLDGQLPPLRSLLLANYETELRVSTAELVSVAKRVSLVTERNSQLRLRFDTDGLVVEAGGAEEAKASEAMDCEYAGEAMKVAFNPQYLLDGLSAISAPTAVFSIGPANRGIVLTGAGNVNEDSAADYSGFKYMLQPLRFES